MSTFAEKSQHILQMAPINDKVIGLIKRASGLEFRKSKDYATLATLISESTGEQVSDNTLRRVMGVKFDGGTPRLSTLDIVARYLGYENWDDLADGEVDKHPKANSGFRNEIQEIVSAELSVGRIVTLCYQPNRRLELLYEGNSIFKVIQSNSDNLHSGDRLTINSFIEQQTLFISRVERKGKNIGQYIAGEYGGLKKISVSDNVQ